jgi:hypothetical protein
MLLEAHIKDELAVPVKEELKSDNKRDINDKIKEEIKEIS